MVGFCWCPTTSPCSAQHTDELSPKVLCSKPEILQERRQLPAALPVNQRIALVLMSSQAAQSSECSGLCSPSEYSLSIMAANHLMSLPCT